MDNLRAALEAALRRASEATPGPWRCSYRGDGSGSVYGPDDALDDVALLDDAHCPYMRGEVRYEDGVFAVAARAEHPALIRFALAVEAVMPPEGTPGRTALGAAIREALAALDRDLGVGDA